MLSPPASPKPHDLERASASVVVSALLTYDVREPT